MTDNATRAGSIRALHASPPPQPRPPAKLTPEQGAMAALADAEINRDNDLPATIKALYADRSLTYDDVRAIKRLLSDIKRTSASSDAVWLEIEPESEDPETGDRLGVDAPGLVIAFDPHHHVLATDESGVCGDRVCVDPDTLHVEGGTPARFHERKLTAAMAPGRLSASLAAVDKDVCPGALRTLAWAAHGISWSEVARRCGLSDKTVKEHATLAARALRRHYAGEDDRSDRSVFPVWGATADWRQTDDGREIVARCATRFLSLHQPVMLGPIPFLKLAERVSLDHHPAVQAAASGGNILPQTIAQKVRREVRDILIATERWRQIGLALDRGGREALSHGQRDALARDGHGWETLPRAGRETLEGDLRADAIGARLPVLDAGAMALACERQFFVAKCRMLPSPGKTTRILF